MANGVENSSLKFIIKSFGWVQSFANIVGYNIYLCYKESRTKKYPIRMFYVCESKL